MAKEQKPERGPTTPKRTRPPHLRLPALARADRGAYHQHPERPDDFWTDAEAWGRE